MADVSILDSDGNALFFRSKKFEKKNPFKHYVDSLKQGNESASYSKIEGLQKSHQCEKIGHIQKNCRVKLKGGNVQEKDVEREED